MNNVALDQNWGVTSGSDISSDYVKNGWTTVSGKYDPNGNENSTWIINSNGQVKLSNGETYTISVLTNGNRSKESGIELVDRIGAKVYQILNQ